MIKKIQRLLKSSSKVIITTHKNPDGDAMGSSLALNSILNKIGIESIVIIPNAYPSNLNWMEGVKDVVNYDLDSKNATKLIENAELIFCLDFNSLKRVGNMSKYIKNSKAKTILIDHHEEPELIFDFSYSFPKISSTCQLIYEFLIELNLIEYIDIKIAENLYAGIVTDTGSFKYSSVDIRTHQIVSNLLLIGLKQDQIHNKLHNNQKEKRLKLLGYAINKKLKIYYNFNTAIIDLSINELNMFDYERGDTDGIINYALSIEKISLAVIFIEEKDKIKISFRSKNNFKTNILSKKYFNGGGHINASGGIYYGKIEDGIKKLISILPNYKTELSKNT